MLQVLSCDMVAKGMLAISGALLIRYMTETEYAVYSVGYALLLVFIQLCSGALNRVYVIGFDRFDLQSDSGVLVRLQLLLVCAGAPALIALIGIRKPAAWLCGGAMLFGCGAEMVKSRFQQQMQFGRYSSVEFVRSFVVCLGVLAAIWLTGWQPAASTILAIQVAAYASALALHGLPPLNLSRGASWLATRRLARELWNGPYRYLFIYFVILAVFGQIDLFVLRWAGTQRQVATYAAAYRYYNVLLLAITAANAVLLPSAQRAKSAEDTAGLRRQHRAGLYLFAPLVLCVMLLAPWLIPVVNGGRYPESVTVFQILAVSSLLSFVLSPALNLVLGAEDFQFLLLAASVSCVLGPVLNLLLIPRYGAVGTAWSLLISLGTLNAAGFWRSARYQSMLPMAAAA